MPLIERIVRMLLRLLPYLAGILTIIAIITTIYHKGVESERGNQALRAVKGVELHDKIEKSTMSATDADLDKRMQHWFRD
jgi:hypothetical protein